MTEQPKIYWRALIEVRPTAQSLPLAGGWVSFSQVERITRNQGIEILPASALPDDIKARLTSKRADICGLTMAAPKVMGILNVTPDSFSDGGRSALAADALKNARAMLELGADLIDVGGESTRPGAKEISIETELSRVEPVLEGLQALDAPVSIDTRKAEVASRAFALGAGMFNDVSALRFDPNSLAVAAQSGKAVCLMHAQGLPENMQDNPTYDDTLLDVYDHLEERIVACEAAGIDRDRIMIDPGIGFGKNLDHNLALIRGVSLFHSLGCSILLGVSRKGMVGALTAEKDAMKRMPGSVAAALFGVQQGVQMLRVHDVWETAQAVRMYHGLAAGQ